MYNSHLLDLMQCRLLTKVAFQMYGLALVLGAVRACCIERQLITLQLKLAGGQLELELELAI